MTGYEYDVLIPLSPLFKMSTFPSAQGIETLIRPVLILLHQIFVLKYMETIVNFVKILFLYY